MELLITLLAGMSVALGGIIVRLAHDTRRVERVSMSVALGALVSLLLFDLGPEVVEIYADANPLVPIGLVALGAALLKLLDLMVPDHDGSDGGHAGQECGDANAVHIGLMSAVALVVHNIIEGMSIYSVALSSLGDGVLYAIGIMLHNVPVGMLVFATLQGERPVVRHSVLTAVTFSTFVGGLVMAGIATALPESALGVPLCIAVGMVVYIAFFELLGRVWRARPARTSVVGVLVGFALVMLSALFE